MYTTTSSAEAHLLCCTCEELKWPKREATQAAAVMVFSSSLVGSEASYKILTDAD
jgi:hypothetical protein